MDEPVPRKPVHTFALFLWVLASLVIVIATALDVPLWRAVKIMELQEHMTPEVIDAVTWREIWITTRTSATAAAELAAFGFVVDILDRILWQVTSPEHRAVRRNRYLSARLGRLRVLGLRREGGAD